MSVKGISGEKIYRIVLADDHDSFRQFLKKMIARKSGLEVIGEVSDGVKLIGLLNNITPDMVILDLSMPNLPGLEAAHEIKVKHPGINILILTMHKNIEYLRCAISAGVKGYLLKENIDIGLFPAIETIRNNGVYFPNF